MQMVNLMETAGRELLALQKEVGANSSTPGGTSNLPNSFGVGCGAGPFGSFGGGAAAAAVVTAASNRGFGSGGGAGGAERQRDVVRLCAVTEVTSVLLCTLSMALSQVRFVAVGGDVRVGIWVSAEFGVGIVVGVVAGIGWWDLVSFSLFVD